MTSEDVAEEMARTDRGRRRVVISLQKEMEQWLEKADPQDATRVISGGPGSGKSAFARIFAAQIAQVMSDNYISQVTTIKIPV